MERIIVKDKEFLQWLHDRFMEIYKVDKNIDYLCKLRSVIAEYPEDKITPNTK